MALNPLGRRAFRFSLGALLFVTLCVCGYLAGYRRGLTAGNLAQPTSGLYSVSYSVADLITPAHEPDTPAARSALGDQLVSMIVELVEPATWLENGGADGEIQWNESNESLAIRQSCEVHDRVDNLLKHLRSHPGTVEAYSLRRDLVTPPY
jgi:hypothetical protein